MPILNVAAIGVAVILAPWAVANGWPTLILAGALWALVIAPHVRKTHPKGKKR